MSRATTKGRRQAGGYTFLEIAIALTVVAVLLAAVIPLAAPSREERRLRETMGRIEGLVRTGRLEAEKSGRALALRCEPEGIVLMSGKESLEQARTEGTELYVKLWGEADWRKARGQEWKILSVGVVIPAGVRLVVRGSWLENDFDPLTGDAINERYSF